MTYNTDPLDTLRLHDICTDGNNHVILTMTLAISHETNETKPTAATTTTDVRTYLRDLCHRELRLCCDNNRWSVSVAPRHEQSQGHVADATIMQVSATAYANTVYTYDHILVHTSKDYVCDTVSQLRANNKPHARGLIISVTVHYTSPHLTRWVDREQHNKASILLPAHRHQKHIPMDINVIDQLPSVYTKDTGVVGGVAPHQYQNLDPATIPLSPQGLLKKTTLWSATMLACITIAFFVMRWMFSHSEVLNPMYLTLINTIAAAGLMFFAIGSDQAERRTLWNARLHATGNQPQLPVSDRPLPYDTVYDTAPVLTCALQAAPRGYDKIRYANDILVAGRANNVIDNARQKLALASRPQHIPILSKDLLS